MRWMAKVRVVRRSGGGMVVVSWVGSLMSSSMSRGRGRSMCRSAMLNGRPRDMETTRSR